MLKQIRRRETCRVICHEETTSQFSVFQRLWLKPICRDSYSSVIPIFDGICRGESVNIDGDGCQTRDFIHVSDVVKTMLQAAEQNDSTPFDIVNLELVMESLFWISNLISHIVSRRSHQTSIIHGPPRGAIFGTLLGSQRVDRYTSPNSFVPLKMGFGSWSGAP